MTRLIWAVFLLGEAVWAADPAAMDLSQFEQLALHDNPTMQQARQLVYRSAGLAKQAGLLPNPSVGYQGEQIRGGAYGGGEQGAFVQQTFVLGGKLGLRRNAYEQQRRTDEIGVEEQRQRVLGEVDQRFYATLAAQESVKLRERLLQIATDAVQTAHQLANVGQADAPDVLQSEVEAAQAKLEYRSAQRMFAEQFAMLAAVAGQSDLALTPLKGTLDDYPVVDAARAVEELLQNSPAIKKAEQDVTRAEADWKSARRESVPDMQVHAGIQNNSEPIGAFGRTSVGMQGFVTAGIALPLFDRNQGAAGAREADVERARAEVKRARLALKQAAQPVLAGYLSAQEAAQLYKNEMIPKAQQAYQLSFGKYQEMGATYMPVILAQRTLFQLQVAYVGALGELWSNAIALQHFLLVSGLDAQAVSSNSLPAAAHPIGGE